MKVKMADENKTSSDDQPTFVITQPPVQSSMKYKLTRKHILIAVVTLIVTGLIVTGVLVGMRIHSDTHLAEMKLKYSVTLKDKDDHDIKQNVSTEANIVQYHVVKDGSEAWILQDFDKNIEVSKVKSGDSVACYVTALNRSEAGEPDKIPSTEPELNDKTQSRQLIYRVDDKPISDITFLGKRPSKLCENIPTYWVVPNCEAVPDVPENNTAPANDEHNREKRATVCGYCYGYSYRYGWRYYQCVCGCCYRYCAVFASSMYRWALYWSPYYGYYYSCTYYIHSYSTAYNGAWCTRSLSSSRCVYGGRNYYYPWS